VGTGRVMAAGWVGDGRVGRARECRRLGACLVGGTLSLTCTLIVCLQRSCAIASQAEGILHVCESSFSSLFTPPTHCPLAAAAAHASCQPGRYQAVTRLGIQHRAALPAPHRAPVYGARNVLRCGSRHQG